MLIVEDLTKAYRQTVAVSGLSFSVADGEILGLLGPNGAGKTTTLRCIAGVLRPTEGRIVVAGRDLKTEERAAKAALAFVPETPYPYEMLTTREHLEFIARAYGRADGFRANGDALLSRFDLLDKADDLVLTLSKGMKQKLALACAFVHDTRVFLLDEPLIGIDPRGARELKNLIAEAKADGCSILVSTHMLDTAERLCDRILILHRGQKLAEGDLAELHARARMGAEASLEDVFLNLTQEQDSPGGPPDLPRH